MPSRPALPEDFEDTSVSMDHLLTEYEDWSGLLNRDSDEYELISKTKALYRFAITNYNEPGRDLLLQAIRTFEAAKRED